MFDISSNIFQHYNHVTILTARFFTAIGMQNSRFNKLESHNIWTDFLDVVGLFFFLDFFQPTNSRYTIFEALKIKWSFTSYGFHKTNVKNDVYQCECDLIPNKTKTYTHLHTLTRTHINAHSKRVSWEYRNRFAIHTQCSWNAIATVFVSFYSGYNPAQPCAWHENALWFYDDQHFSR